MSDVKIFQWSHYCTALVSLKQEAADTWAIQGTHGRVILSSRELRDLGFCIDTMRGDRDAKESAKTGNGGV